MPIVPVGFGQMVHSYELPGDAEPMVITYGLDLTGPSDPQDIVNDIDLVWKVELDDILSEDYTMIGSTLYVGFPGNTTVPFTSTGSSQPGQLSGALPQNNAILVQKRSGLAGRHNRGRFYLPGVQAAAITSLGAMSGATLTAWQDILDSFLAGVEAIQPMVILHANEDTPTPVTALVVQQTIATQRQRLRR